MSAIGGGLDYPKVNIYSYVGFQPTLEFLERLCDAFDWETYESSTLGRVNKEGKHSNLRFYATLLIQWLTGNDIILFRLSNYFMRFSTELKKYHYRDFLTNDWYEYMEYGTTNKVCILLQKNGFLPETATYIQKHEDIYIVRTDEEVKVSLSLLQM